MHVMQCAAGIWVQQLNCASIPWLSSQFSSVHTSSSEIFDAVHAVPCTRDQNDVTCCRTQNLAGVFEGVV